MKNLIITIAFVAIFFGCENSQDNAANNGEKVVFRYVYVYPEYHEKIINESEIPNFNFTQEEKDELLETGRLRVFFALRDILQPIMMTNCDSTVEMTTSPYWFSGASNNPAFSGTYSGNEAFTTSGGRTYMYHDGTGKILYAFARSPWLSGTYKFVSFWVKVPNGGEVFVTFDGTTSSYNSARFYVSGGTSYVALKGDSAGSTQSMSGDLTTGVIVKILATSSSMKAYEETELAASISGPVTFSSNSFWLSLEDQNCAVDDIIVYNGNRYPQLIDLNYSNF